MDFTQVIASIETCGNNMNTTNYYLLVLDGQNFNVTIDVPMKKWGDLQVTLQLRPFTTNCNSSYFYKHECYQTSCMSYNSSYVKPYTYATRAT